MFLYYLFIHYRFIDKKTKRKISIRQAIKDGQLNPREILLVDPLTNQIKSLETLIAEGRFNPDTGCFLDPRSGEWIPMDRAIDMGLIAPELKTQDLLEGRTVSVESLLGGGGGGVDRGDTLFVLPNGMTMSLKEAVKKGLLSKGTKLKVRVFTLHLITL